MERAMSRQEAQRNAGLLGGQDNSERARKERYRLELEAQMREKDARKMREKHGDAADAVPFSSVPKGIAQRHARRDVHGVGGTPGDAGLSEAARRKQQYARELQEQIRLRKEREEAEKRRNAQEDARVIEAVREGKDGVMGRKAHHGGAGEPLRDAYGRPVANVNQLSPPRGQAPPHGHAGGAAGHGPPGPIPGQFPGPPAGAMGWGHGPYGAPPPGHPAYQGHGVEGGVVPPDVPLGGYPGQMHTFASPMYPPDPSNPWGAQGAAGAAGPGPGPGPGGDLAGDHGAGDVGEFTRERSDLHARESEEQTRTRKASQIEMAKALQEQIAANERKKKVRSCPGGRVFQPLFVRV